MTEYQVPTGVVPKIEKRRIHPLAQGVAAQIDEYYAERPPVAISPMVGDVNSTARGSGARYNHGKAHLELIPLRLIADYYSVTHKLRGGEEMDTMEGIKEQEALTSLGYLAAWQEEGEVSQLRAAMHALGDCFEECAAVFDYGRAKYAEWNWAKGMQWSIPLACAARHLKKILDGEEIDSESNLPHRAHVYCNLVMLLTFIRTYPEGNDRPTLLKGTNVVPTN